ncbi:HAD family hydrolase [Streptomyces sp. TRM68367]|uniref:HAD family hydrolase n=1 Tax=Streptomyces sp. TRM68367 TaxID=2758415 RepID=UPI00165BE064|nr:HAD hydrolase-like protein [Streptomyces sp. TRM68367]MBC9729689.1 HAD family hydrolase [Streptomyces sp. TRM68367]
MPRNFNRPHLVWGWRGTLADDVQRQVGAVNAALASLGTEPVDLDTIRRHFATSAPALCAAILGRALTDRERTQANMAFETFHSRRPPAQLVPGTEDLLARLIRSGCSHSVLSLSAHNGLTRHIADMGIASLFLRVEGRTGPSARSKRQPLAKHVAMLQRTIGNRPIVLIGDAVDDVRAALANQVHPVPYAGGLTHPDILRRSGVPVADSLAQAAAFAVAHAHSLN